MPTGVYKRKKPSKLAKKIKLHSTTVSRFEFPQTMTVTQPELKAVAEKTLELLDEVNHPSHYTFGRFEVIEVLEDWFPDDPLLWQTVKYLVRAKHKENFLQDLKKAQFYLNRRIESEEK